jgi:hypothetical protein
MSAQPDEENLNRWLGKHRFEEDKARKEQFEKDKALKDKKPTPWSREAWQAAAARNRAGVVKPERRFPIIITSSTGPFTTPQKLQEVAGLSSLPEVQWTTKTSFFDSEEEGSKGPDSEKPEKVQYCDVNWEQLVRVKEYSDGEDVLVWFQGKKRAAWLARLVKQKSGNQIGDRKS